MAVLSLGLTALVLATFLLRADFNRNNQYVVPSANAKSFISLSLPNGVVVAPMAKASAEKQNILSWTDTRYRSFVIYSTAPKYSVLPKAHPNGAWLAIDRALNEAPPGYPCTKYSIILIAEGRKNIYLPSKFAPYATIDSFGEIAAWMYSPYDRNETAGGNDIGPSEQLVLPPADIYIFMYNTPCVMQYIVTRWYDIQWGYGPDYCGFEIILRIHGVETDVSNALRQWWKDAGNASSCDTK